MTVQARKNYANTNEFLDDLTEKLRTYGSEGEPVKALLQLAEQNPEWKTSAQAAVMLRRAYEQDQPLLPLGKGAGPVSLSSPGGSTWVLPALLAVVVALLVGLILMVNGQLPFFASRSESKGTNPTDNAKAFEAATDRVQAINTELTALQEKAEKALKAAEESTKQNVEFMKHFAHSGGSGTSPGTILFPVSMSDKLNTSQGKWPVDYSVSLGSGADFGFPESPALVGTVIQTEPSGMITPAKLHMWSLASKGGGWTPVDTKRQLTVVQRKELAALYRQLEAQLNKNDAVTVEEATGSLKKAYQEALLTIVQPDKKPGKVKE